MPPARVLPARISETVAPTGLGRNFHWLLASTTVNNIGDGVAISAGPLLVASQNLRQRAVPDAGFVGSAVLVALLWRQFELIVRAGDEGRKALSG